MILSTLQELLKYRAERHPKTPIVTWLNGESESTTSLQFVRMVASYAGFLHQMGLPAGANVMVISESSSTHQFAMELAISIAGFVCCPVSTLMPQPDIIHAIELLDIRCFVTPTRAGTDAYVSGFGQPMIVLDEVDLPDSGARIPDHDADRNAVIVLTSGTSDKPKGVVLTQRNLLSTTHSCAAMIPVAPGQRAISFLPSSHILERIALLTYVLHGVEIHFAGAPLKAAPLMRQIRPHILTVVPRLLERIQTRYRSSIISRGFFTRQLYLWSVSPSGSSVNGVKKVIARYLLLRGLHRYFGGRIRGIVVGGAKMNPDLQKWFQLAGLRLREGYGLSEACGAVTFNPFIPGMDRPGTSGLPLPGVEVKIDTTNAEVLIKSEGVMEGYYNDEQATRRVISDGWLRTGDLGTISPEGRLIVSGRKHHIVKNSYGEFVNPFALELLLNNHELISQSFIIAFQKPYTSAIIVPEEELLIEWCKINNIHWTSLPYMVHNTAVKNHFGKLIVEVNTNLTSYQKIQKFHLAHEQWTPANNLVTLTYKLKRSVLENKYSKAIRNMYATD